MGVPSKKGKGSGKGKGAKGKDSKRQGSTNHQARDLAALLYAFSATAVSASASQQGNRQATVGWHV